MKKHICIGALFLAVVAFTHLNAQGPAGGPPAAQGRGAPPAGARGGAGGRGGIGGYPARPSADPVVLERGMSLYGLHCAFCHGPDARGGSEGGPNLLRSPIVLNDEKGELISGVIRNGQGAMPKLDLSPEQISDVAAFIHSFPVAGYDASRQRPASILVGDAKAGEEYFKSKCASCHSVTGDLKGFGARNSDPQAIQQAWLMPAGGRGAVPGITDVPPVTATVALPTGERFEGRLMKIDDFIVALQLADESHMSFRRNGDIPKVEVHDPMAPHRALLRVYTDKDIHNLTAYLVTLK